MPTACFLSPHLDDAVFSAGGTMARLADDGWRVILATVFTRSVPNPSGFALRCQTDKGLAPDVDYMALRRAEDAAAAAAVGAGHVVWLDLPEAPHRGYTSAAELFGPVHADDVGTAEAVARASREVVGGCDLLFTPVGIGGHVDHVHVVRAVGTLSRPSVAWHDSPYVLRLLPDVPSFNRAVDIATSLERKLAGCAAYTSQLGFQFGGVDTMRERLASRIERFACGPASAAGWPGLCKRSDPGH